MTLAPAKGIDCTALAVLNPLQSPDMGLRELYRRQCTTLVAPWDANWDEWLANTAPAANNGLISP